MKTMLHNLSKAKKSVIAALLCMSMVIGLLLAVPPVSAQAVEINAQDQGFTLYGLGSGTTTGFANGDKISVTNTSRTADSKKTAVYSYDGDGWSKDGDDYVVWQGTGENTFEAYYPVAEYASYTEFTLPVDQTAGVSAADWMTATYTGTKGDNDAIDLTFNHRLAKVTVKVTGWGDEYTGEETLSAPEFAGKHSAVTANADGLTGNDTAATISTAWDSDKAATAILIPATYGKGDAFFTFKVDEETLTVNAPAELNLKSGNHYTFNLTVGKETVTLTSVAVTGWADGGTIDGGVAEEVVNLNIINATDMSTDDLNAAVTKALSAGHTDISITLAATPDTHMFTAIRNALTDTDGVADGSINLTISGAKTVPEDGFIDWVDYYDNGEKNIAGDKLKSLTLTDVETIGDNAFSACTYLESVNLPQVVTVGDMAFNAWEKGTKLTSLDLPNATTIGKQAFAYSSLLTSVNLPKVTSIGVRAFGYCDLRTLILPEVTTIGGAAFRDNYNLESCSAPKATTIYYYPWGDCSKLATLELTAAGGFTLGNNLFENTPTGQINLVLNEDKASQVTQNDDGTATWTTTASNNYTLEYTFKSITFVGE